MQRLARSNPRRPRAPSADMARDHKQAAMHLVRLEFEIDRLERALRAERDRAALHERDLAIQQAQRSKLMAILSGRGARDV